jgi:hypothetical protein
MQAVTKLPWIIGGSASTPALGVVYDHTLAGFTALLAGEASLRHFIQAGMAHATGDVLAVVARLAASIINLPLLLLLQNSASPFPAIKK